MPTPGPVATATGRRESAPARPDAVRRHNLARLVTEVHRHGELSRAELTGRLGLNRSTIGTLAAELVAGGLLEGSVPGVDRDAQPAGHPGGASAGRPSHRVRPRPDGPFVVAVDLEVGRVGVASVGLGGTPLVRADHAVRTRRPAGMATAVARAVWEVVAATPGFAVGVGVSVPGSVSRGSAVVTLAPNLEWRDVDLGALLRAAFAERGLADLPVQVANDANLGAMAEHVRGQARDHADLVFLLGRVGVGAGIVADDHLLQGSVGAAGEVGHLCLSVDGPPCHCGSAGCAEVYIGDAALVAAAGRSDDPTREAVAAVLASAEAGDAAALAAVRQVGHDLGRTVAALLNLVNPSLVVAGGTLARVLDLAGDDVRAALARFSFDRAGARVELRASTSSTADACLLGAAELAFAPLLADPAAFALHPAAAAVSG